MFHGMDSNSANAIFRYLPVLSFTESYIYQLDTLNERILDTLSHRGARHGESSNMQENGRRNTESVQAFESNPFRPLLPLLEQKGLLTERIREELKCGEEYWALERKLCGEPENTVKKTEVMRAIHLKSFDYRVLDLLMYEVRKAKVNELNMEFLSVSELLVEIADDLSVHSPSLVFMTFTSLYSDSNSLLLPIVVHLTSIFFRTLHSYSHCFLLKIKIRNAIFFGSSPSTNAQPSSHDRSEKSSTGE